MLGKTFSSERERENGACDALRQITIFYVKSALSSQDVLFVCEWECEREREQEIYRKDIPCMCASRENIFPINYGDSVTV